jgi:phage terminase large subunit-like protein
MATSEVDQFRRFAAAVGLHLEPFQIEVMEAVLSDYREATVSQPRGAGKTTLMGCYALYVLARTPAAQIVCAAAARDQAQHLFRAAEGFAKRVPALRRQLTFTQREIRTPERGRLTVISADSEKQMGWDPDLVIVDELGSHRDDSLYVSMRSAMIKNPRARMRIISTMGGHEDAPMPSMRRRVLEEGTVVRDGAALRAGGRDVLWLEWSVPEGADIDDMRVVKAANPRAAITMEMLAEHRRVLREVAFRRLHCNQHVAGDAAFLAADEWDACNGTPDIPQGARVVIGVDASIRHDCTSVVVVRKDDQDVFHAQWRVWEPDGGRNEVQLSDVERYVAGLADRFTVEAVVFDPRYFIQAGQNLSDQGVNALEWVHSRMPNAVNTLREVIVHQRLRHGGDEIARRHALAAETTERDYGVILTKRKTREPNDALVSLAMAIEFAQALKPPRKSVYEDRYGMAA